MKRAILKPNGHWVGLGEYVRSWRTTLTLPPKAQIKGWDHFPADAKDVLRDLRFGLHDRINRHMPHYGKGRKWETRWQIDCWRDARMVNEYASRRIVHPCNRLSIPELQRRFQWSYHFEDGLSIRLHNRRAA